MAQLALFGRDPESGIVINLAQVPSSDTPAEDKGSHLRSTGEGFTDGLGHEIARVEVVSGPHPDARD